MTCADAKPESGLRIYCRYASASGRAVNEPSPDGVPAEHEADLKLRSQILQMLTENGQPLRYTQLPDTAGRP
jgi:hypothetical protein